MIEGISTAPQAEQMINGKAQEQKSQFLQLLVAQMTSQNPLNPMEGADFVAQLAQFTSLEELINIRGIMEQVNSTLDAQAASTATTRNPFSNATEN